MQVHAPVEVARDVSLLPRGFSYLQSSYGHRCMHLWKQPEMSLSFHAASLIYRAATDTQAHAPANRQRDVRSALARKKGLADEEGFGTGT